MFDGFSWLFLLPKLYLLLLEHQVIRMHVKDPLLAIQLSVPLAFEWCSGGILRFGNVLFYVHKTVTIVSHHNTTLKLSDNITLKHSIKIVNIKLQLC